MDGPRETTKVFMQECKGPGQQNGGTKTTDIGHEPRY